MLRKDGRKVIPKKILVCTDFSENSLPARQCAVEWAKAFKAELAILHVVNSRFFGYPTFADRVPMEMALIQQNIEEGVREELDSIANKCRKGLSNVQAHSRAGSPAEEIIRFADEESVDLIIMGTHGWTGVRHMILGSTAENVVRTANCPVLSVRPKTG
jgi:universal stress protein A